MLTLYGLLGCLLIMALLILAIPFIKNRSQIKSYFLISLFTIVFTLSFYFTLGKPAGLENWLSTGRNHYQLLIEMDRLGGIDGIIQRIQIKLKNNPNDAKGWMILGKMYLLKKDQAKAEEAFAKVKQLKQNLA